MKTSRVFHYNCSHSSVVSSLSLRHMRITFDQGLFFILYILCRYVVYPYSKKVSSFIAQGHRLEASWLRVELKCSARCMHFSHLGQTAVIHSYRGVRIIFLEASSGSKMLRLEFWRWFAQEMALVRECTLASVYRLPRKSRIPNRFQNPCPDLQGPKRPSSSCGNFFIKKETQTLQ